MFFAINPKISTEKCNGRCEKVDKDEVLNEDDRNLKNIVCRRCGSIFFPENTVEYIQNYPHDLRVMTHQGAGPLQEERISWWWFSKDDMEFDTIGWQTIDKKKVLMCGDCELGPVGFRSDDDKQFWVAVERVSYKESEEGAGGNDSSTKKGDASKKGAGSARSTNGGGKGGEKNRRK